MSVETVVTEGFGSFGDVAHVVTDGFGIGLAPSTPADATILTQAFGALTAASAFVVTEGFRSGTPTPTPTPTGQVDTHDGGERKIWYQRTYREPTKRELRSAIERLPGEVVAELEALAEPQVQDSVYRPLELRINMEALAQREELIRRIVEAARLSDEEDEDFLLLI